MRSAYITILHVTYRIGFVGNLKNRTPSLCVDAHLAAWHLFRLAILLKETEYNAIQYVHLKITRPIM